MEALVRHVREIASTADAAARGELMVTLRDLAYSIEEPNDTLNRIGYLVSGDLNSSKSQRNSSLDANVGIGVPSTSKRQSFV